MNKLNRIILAFAFSVSSIAVQSQNAAGELALIRNAYLQCKQLSFDVEVYSYSNKTDKVPELVSKGNVRKKEENYYSGFGEYELLIKGAQGVLVNNREKTMRYYMNKTEKQKWSEGMALNMDSVFSVTDSIVLRPATAGTKHLTIFSKAGYIRQTELYIDAKSNLITHILYYYVPSTDDYEIEVDRVEVFYKNVSTQYVDESYFDFNRYFKLSKTVMTPVGKYQKYKTDLYNSKS